MAVLNDLGGDDGSAAFAGGRRRGVGAGKTKAHRGQRTHQIFLPALRSDKSKRAARPQLPISRVGKVVSIQKV
ncbi:hypothetical protein SDC9_156350 [bioreactor metagenome]|uniref:Uncharacterized protein n=1 Tax=bioreactor metagenome TaxID=1076179 RepID=A0A645F6A6_9ZZZZ